MTQRRTVLVIDDEQDLLEGFSRMLARWGYRALTASSGEAGLRLLTGEHPDAVITDLRMPGSDGLVIVRAVKEFDPEIIVIVLTAYGTVDTAVSAMKAGAYDYLTKPFSSEEFKIVLHRAFEQRDLREDNRRLRRTLRAKDGLEALVGESKPMARLKELLSRVAEREINVILTGESGTGKEVAAKTIHRISDRRDKVFVPIDCASIPDNLLESELFGYERGAFTGADVAKPGLIEIASGGTLFLDEIGEMSLAQQAKLLRVLEERKTRRLGSTGWRDVDLRVIAATNRDLQEAVAGHSFREDLFYRLGVITVRIPPLRERLEDISALVAHFLQDLRQRNRLEKISLSPEAVRKLQNHIWPGNVRELRNVLEAATVMASGELIGPEDLWLGTGELAEAAEGREFTGAFVAAKEQAVVRFEKKYLEQLLAATDHNLSEAARQAGLNRRTIYRLLERHHLER